MNGVDSRHGHLICARRYSQILPCGRSDGILRWCLQDGGLQSRSAQRLVVWPALHSPPADDSSGKTSQPVSPSPNPLRNTKAACEHLLVSVVPYPLDPVSHGPDFQCFAALDLEEPTGTAAFVDAGGCRDRTLAWGLIVVESDDAVTPGLGQRVAATLAEPGQPPALWCEREAGANLCVRVLAATLYCPCRVGSTTSQSTPASPPCHACPPLRAPCCLPGLSGKWWTAVGGDAARHGKVEWRPHNPMSRRTCTRVSRRACWPAGRVGVFVGRNLRTVPTYSYIHVHVP